MNKDFRNLNKKSKDELIEIIQDYQDDFRRVLSEQCPTDERHCGCVPILRTKIANYQNALILITTFPSSKHQTFAEREMQRVAFDVLDDPGSQKLDATKYWVEKYEYLQSEYNTLFIHAESAERRVYQLRNMILVLLDQIDYTSGACQINEMVGAVLGTNLIRSARELVRGGEG